MRPVMVAAVAALLSACATPGSVTPESALEAVGLTREAYCALTPEARAEVRRLLEIRVPLLACPNDRNRRARRGTEGGAAGQD